MASVASQLIEEVTAHSQSDSLEDAREICAGGTYFPNNLRRIAMHSPMNIKKETYYVAPHLNFLTAVNVHDHYIMVFLFSIRFYA